MTWCRLFSSFTLAFLSSLAAAAPPKVAEFDPPDGSQAVPPELRQIRITFDQPMTRGGYSLCGGGDDYPDVLCPARWVDDRTLAVPVKLRPNHQYRLAVNSPDFDNFRSATGEPAVVTAYSFKTGPARDPAAPPKATPAENRASVDDLRRFVDEDYAYRDSRDLDWDALFTEFAPRIEAAATPQDFAAAVAAMLAHADDYHIWVRYDGQDFPVARRSVRRNYSFDLLPRLVPQWRQRSDVVWTGRFDDGIHYVLLAGLPGDPDAYDPAFEAVALAADMGKGLILDVRPNGGGDEARAAQFAGCFADRPRVYARDVIREYGRFSPVLDRTLQPNLARPRFKGNVAVLMGPTNMSSCESLLMMMKACPNITLLGQTSCGSSGRPVPHALTNGVIVFLPSWRDLFPDGRPLEGVGVSPDVEVETTPDDFVTIDPVLDAALDLLRSK